MGMVLITQLELYFYLLGAWGVSVFGLLGLTGWGPLVISRVIRALNWVIRTLN